MTKGGKGSMRLTIAILLTTCTCMENCTINLHMDVHYAPQMNPKIAIVAAQ